MRFSIEQIFLTDSSGKPLGDRPPAAFHVVEADTPDAALSTFLGEQQANLIGNIQRLPGAQALATAQHRGTAFTLHAMAGSDAFHQEQRAAGTDTASSAVETPRDSERPL